LLSQFCQSSRHSGWAYINHTLAVSQHERIEVNQPPNAISRSIGNTSYDRSSVTVANQHNVSKVLIMQRCQHVLNVRR
jgi:hypothetical protein